MKKFLWICLSSLVSANTVFAGGYNAPAYGHESHESHAVRVFNGFSIIGGVGGVGMDLDADQSVTGTTSFTDLTFLETVSDSPDAFDANVAGMLGLGYSYQSASGLVLGLFATANSDFVESEDTVTSSDASFGGVNTAVSFSSKLETELRNDFALLVKAGFVLNHNTLFYGLVGPRWGNFESELNSVYNYSDTEGFIGNVSAEDESSEYIVGYTVGAGISHAVTRHLMLGMEYAFSAYNDVASLDTVNRSPLVPTDSFFCVDSHPVLCSVQISGDAEVDVHTNTVMATIAYKF